MEETYILILDLAQFFSKTPKATSEEVVINLCHNDTDCHTKLQNALNELVNAKRLIYNKHTKSYSLPKNLTNQKS